MKWPLQKILIHVLCWTAFLALPVIVSPKFSIDNLLPAGDPEYRNLIGSAMMILFFYANFYYFIPSFYHKKRYVAFIVLCIVCFAIIIALPSFIYPDHGGFYERMPPKMLFNGMTPPNGFPPNGFPPDGFHPDRSSFRFQIFQFESSFLKFLIVFVLSMLLKTRELWEQARSEKQATELSYLKLQVNPHFLFNTLNGIYSLALIKSDKTPDAIVKLSELMRYVTGEVGDDFVPLSKEIQYITNYIDLQRIRLEDTASIDYRVEGDYSAAKIAPLLLIPFIENAFKFGVNPEESSPINVHISIEKEELTLMVNNKKVRHDLSTSGNKSGLVNVQKRLDLIYPARHTLTVNATKDDYTVELNLQLS
jgi:hypothetical protein